VALRSIQIDTLNRVRRRIALDTRKIILQASTGLGKTVQTAETISRAIEKGNRAISWSRGASLSANRLTSYVPSVPITASSFRRRVDTQLLCSGGFSSNALEPMLQAEEIDLAAGEPSDRGRA
jgi:hypothetical protein